MKKNVLVSVSVLVSFFSATAFAGGGVQNSSLVSPAFTPAEVKTLTSGVSVSTSILPHIPRKHASVELNASVSNRGSETFSGTVTASVVSTFCDSVVGTVNITDLEAYGTRSLTFHPAHFTPQAFGDYQLRYVLSDDSETDTVVSNLFTVTTNEFATDNGLLDGTTSAAAVFGNKFTLVEADSIESVSIAWAHDAPSTEPHDFYVVIYKLDDSDTTLVYKSEDVHTRPHHDLVPPHGEEGGRHAVFETYPVNHKLLEAGDYIFAIEAHTEHTGNVHIGTETNA
ncbi:MAG: hypothetical protein LBE71_00005, partial [Dysgonamonadaceae bacterium]|nr:hypothetical protein [Dysgonamonadaceae bacterium]